MVGSRKSQERGFADNNADPNKADLIVVVGVQHKD